MSFNVTGQRSLFGGAAKDGIVRERRDGFTLCRYSITAFENLKKTEIEMPSCENKMFSFFHTNKIRFAVHYPIWKDDDHETDYNFSFALFDAFGNITTLIDIDESDLCQDDGDRSYIPKNAEYLIYGKSQITELCNYLLLKRSGVSVDEVVENSLALCRKEGFPYPTLDPLKLKESWLNLCGLHSLQSKTSTTGNDIMRHFHQSIYAYRSGDTPSLLEAWEDDEILRKIIKNRILYSGVKIINGKAFVTPQTVVLGLNQAKVAAKISLFRPALARYLIEKYLGDKEYIYDAFQGFLGRALGAGSLGKKYRAGDINETTLAEVKAGCEFLGVDIQNCLNDAWNEGIEDKFGPVDFNKVGMLTCSPYGVGKREVERELSNGVKYKIYEGAAIGAKESWNDSFTDSVYTYDWVERTILLNPHIQRFVFVLDKAGQFEEFVAEEIITDTVFAIVREPVVVIDRYKLRPEHFLHGGKLWEQQL
jgi:hypothetical protein